jgi:hypothetical protein
MGPNLPSAHQPSLCVAHQRAHTSSRTAAPTDGPFRSAGHAALASSAALRVGPACRAHLPSQPTTPSPATACAESSRGRYG